MYGHSSRWCIKADFHLTDWVHFYCQIICFRCQIEITGVKLTGGNVALEQVTKLIS